MEVNSLEDLWKERFFLLASKHWVEDEATFRYGLKDTDGDAFKYERDLIAAIDAELEAAGVTLPGRK